MHIRRIPLSFPPIMSFSFGLVGMANVSIISLNSLPETPVIGLDAELEYVLTCSIHGHESVKMHNNCGSCIICNTNSYNHLSHPAYSDGFNRVKLISTQKIIELGDRL